MQGGGGMQGDGSAKFANGNESAGGGKSSSGKPATAEKVNPKAVYEWAVVRWFGNEVKASEIEKALTGKPWVKGLHTHPLDNLVCVNYYGELKDIDIVRKNVAGGNSVLLSPAKVQLSFELAKGVKEGDVKKCRDKVTALKGIVKIEASANSSVTIFADPSKFDFAKAEEAAKSEGFDMKSGTHERFVVSFKYLSEGQTTDKLKKDLLKQKGAMLVLEMNEVKSYFVILAEKGAVTADVLKKVVTGAGFGAGDVTVK